jgi:hypothetical protein
MAAGSYAPVAEERYHLKGYALSVELILAAHIASWLTGGQESAGMKLLGRPCYIRLMMHQL